MSQQKLAGLGYWIGFIACIPLANYLIHHVGTTCVPGGPCLIPVAPGGVMAPSGVLTIGLALVLRDLVQRRLGPWWAVIAILTGGALSALLAPPALVVASTTAFLLSEFIDFAIYTPLQRRRFLLAVLLSSLVGIVVDSVVFLYLAFGGLDYLLGQVLGKGWMVLLSMPIIAWIRALELRRPVPCL